MMRIVCRQRVHSKAGVSVTPPTRNKAGSPSHEQAAQRYARNVSNEAVKPTYNKRVTESSSQMCHPGDAEIPMERAQGECCLRPRLEGRAKKRKRTTRKSK